MDCYYATSRSEKKNDEGILKGLESETILDFEKRSCRPVKLFNLEGILMRWRERIYYLESVECLINNVSYSIHTENDGNRKEDIRFDTMESLWWEKWRMKNRISSAHFHIGGEGIDIARIGEDSLCDLSDRETNGPWSVSLQTDYLVCTKMKKYSVWLVASFWMKFDTTVAMFCTVLDQTSQSCPSIFNERGCCQSVSLNSLSTNTHK